MVLVYSISNLSLKIVERFYSISFLPLLNPVHLVLVEKTPVFISKSIFKDENMERDLDDLTQKMVNSFKGIGDEDGGLTPSESELGKLYVKEIFLINVVRDKKNT